MDHPKMRWVLTSIGWITNHNYRKTRQQTIFASISIITIRVMIYAYDPGNAKKRASYYFCKSRSLRAGTSLCCGQESVVTF